MSSKANKTIIVALLAGAVVILLLAGFLLPYFLTGAPEGAIIKLRRGSTIDQVADSIAGNIDVRFAERVERLLTLTGSDLSARQGAFKVDKGDSPYTVLRLLRSGSPSGIRFTFNNVRTHDEFARRWGDKFMLDSADMARALSDTVLLASLDRTRDNVSAMLFPDSYEFYWDITPEDFLAKMKGYYDRFWNEKRVKQAEALGLTPDQVAIIASIVEEETAKADERPKVARLYLNRLAIGMPLQADPTVKFALGDFALRRITVAMTRTPSPYNTYYNKGLPPGPIRMPEKGALDAVLNAPQHDYLYMCASDDFSGYHKFAVDYDTHLANARRYQAALDARGIK